MIALFLLLSAQSVGPSPDTPPAAPPPPHRVCRRAPGSEQIICHGQSAQGSYQARTPPPQAYGPAAPGTHSILGDVKIRGQASNSARRRRSGATLSVPF